MDIKHKLKSKTIESVWSISSEKPQELLLGKDWWPRESKFPEIVNENDLDDKTLEWPFLNKWTFESGMQLM